MEEIRTGAVDPLPVPGGRRIGGNMPGGGKGPEMIEAKHIHVSQSSAEAIDAPAIVGLPQRLPVIDRIAPELPLRTESIGRDAGDDGCALLAVEQEKFRMRPHVTGIGGDEKRKIA